MNSTTNNSNIQQIVIFNVGPHLCGIDIDQVQEINKNFYITSIHRAPEYVSGVVNLRGQIVSAINLRKKMNLEDKMLDHDSRLIIVNWRGELVGLITDNVHDILEIPNTSINPVPINIENDLKGCFSGIYHSPDGLVEILSIHGVLN